MDGVDLLQRLGGASAQDAANAWPSVPTMALLTGAGAVATCIAVNRSAARSSEAVQEEHLKRTPSVIDGQVEHTLPRLQAGKLHDLEMCYLSWRDIRPYHLPGCSCSASVSLPIPLTMFTII